MNHFFYCFLENKCLYYKSFSGKCIIRCCIKHGLPLKCLEDGMNTMAEDKRNKSDVMMIKTVDGKECEKYRAIMDDCKSECDDENKTPPQKSITPDIERKSSSKGQGIKPPFVEVSLEIDEIPSKVGPEEVKQRSFVGSFVTGWPLISPATPLVGKQ